MPRDDRHTVVALHGPEGVGKSTLAQHAVEFASSLGMRATVLSFADPLRSMLRGLGLTSRDMSDRTAKLTPHPLLCGKTPREAMRTLGTEWGRDTIGASIWATAWLMRACQFFDSARGDALVIVDDLRFSNELVMLGAVRPSIKVLTIELRREGCVFSDAHVSDSRLDGCAHVVELALGVGRGPEIDVASATNLLRLFSLVVDDTDGRVLRDLATTAARVQRVTDMP